MESQYIRKLIRLRKALHIRKELQANKFLGRMPAAWKSEENPKSNRCSQVNPVRLTKRAPKQAELILIKLALIATPILRCLGEHPD